MIRNERFNNGICIEADCYDLATRTYTREEQGRVVTTRPMTDAEWLLHGPQPLDEMGALCALLAATGVITTADAANIAKVTPEALATEVKGWAAAAARKP